MIDFSIIIPAKNEAANIARCLRSIHAECGYPADKYEIILVDNGSTDQTVHIAQKFEAKVYLKPGITIAALRNFGASVAAGSVLVFLDADCSVRNNWLVEASRYLMMPEIVCYGSAPVIPDKATWVQSAWYCVRDKGGSAGETQWLESMNMFVRREAFQSVDGFDETLVTCEDVDLSYRLATLGKIIADPAIQAIHHGEAATLKEFFRKEKWRGASNYKGMIRHGLKFTEIPSLALPLYYGLFILILITAIISGSIIHALTALLLWQAPIIAITAIKLRGRKERLVKFFQLHLIYNDYYLARVSSLFG